MNIKCWWLGHKYNLVDDPDAAHCDRCGELLGYSDFVEDSKYEKAKSLIVYLFFRKWFPAKCGECKQRYGNHDKCIPF